MLAGQRKIASDGYEVMLFPFDEMYITQGETPAHGGTLCMDFVGWSPSTGQINLYPYYAPCSCHCVAKGTNGDWVVFTSDNPVHIPQSPNIPVIVTWQQGHDNNPCNVGDTFTQGDLIGHTGTRGQVSGDHCHFNTVLGTYQGWDYTHTESQLKNSIHIYDCCYIDDTILYRDLGYPWITYGETPPTPTFPERKKFPWYLIASKKLHRM